LAERRPADQKGEPAIDPADNPNLDAGTREVALLTEIRHILREEMGTSEH